MKRQEKLKILSMIAAEAAFMGAEKSGSIWVSRHGERICSNRVMRDFVDRGYVKIWGKDYAHITPYGDDVLKNLQEGVQC